MNLVIPTLAEIEERTLARLKSGPLAGLREGGVLHTLVRAILEEIGGDGGFYAQLKQAAAGAHLGTAEGEDLDGIGTFFGAAGKRQEGESDAAYRYRLSNFVPAQDQGSYARIVAAARAVDGVSAVATQLYAFGPGSFALVYQGTADVETVKAALTHAVAPGTYYQIYKVRELPLKLTAAVRFAPETGEADRQQARAAAVQAARRFVLSRTIGEALVLDVLKRQIIDAHPALVDCEFRALEVDGTSQPLHDVVVPWDAILTLADGSAVEIL